MKIVMKDCFFENIGTCISAPEDANLDLQYSGNAHRNVGKVVEIRSRLNDLVGEPVSDVQTAAMHEIVDFLKAGEIEASPGAV